jgi:pyruvate,water dikinase
VIEGRQAKKLINKVFQTKYPAITEIKGVTASGGKTSGRVKVILTALELPKMQDGDILVSTMTRPEMITAMKKAAAIVTDEGGITSHAAIISRELGIPCIISTRFASKIFKDGDMVEVDANKGIVKKIT